MLDSSCRTVEVRYGTETGCVMHMACIGLEFRTFAHPWLVRMEHATVNVRVDMEPVRMEHAM